MFHRFWGEGSSKESGDVRLRGVARASVRGEYGNLEIVPGPRRDLEVVSRQRRTTRSEYSYLGKNERYHQRLRRAFGRLSRRVATRGDLKRRAAFLLANPFAVLRAQGEGANTRTTHPSTAARHDKKATRTRKVMLDEHYCCNKSCASHMPLAIHRLIRDRSLLSARYRT